MTADERVSGPSAPRAPAFGYDVFLSHNHADKEWVRELASRLSKHRYNGRPPRPWLDEQVLDPGVLGRDAELTTALDRSRLLVLVLSPEAVQSPWVRYELQYFLARRARDEVLLIRRRPCETPDALRGLDVLDWTDGAELEPNLSKLIARICPTPEADPEEIRRNVGDAWWESFLSGTSGFDPTPTPENSALLLALLQYEIDDAAGEGLALAAFANAGDSMLRLNPGDSYGMKMLLGEILAAAVLSNERYRQVVPRYLAQEPGDALHPVLSFAVLRSLSKLAEIDGRLVDPSAVWAALVKLDGVTPLVLDRKAAATLAGRVAAKMRGTDLGDLLIRVLSTGGEASRTAAIGAITMGEEHSAPVFYLRELQEIARRKTAPPAAAAPPSRRLVALLDGIADAASGEVRSTLQLGIADLQREFGDQRSGDVEDWGMLREEPPAPRIHNGPILGTVRRITAANMEEAALALRVSDVACLSEPRIVDALLDGSGAFLLEEQDTATPLCQRLIGRDRRFAMLERRRLDLLEDGDQIALRARDTTILPGITGAAG